jgi:hypothetical protein
LTQLLSISSAGASGEKIGSIPRVEARSGGLQQGASENAAKLFHPGEVHAEVNPVAICDPAAQHYDGAVRLPS